MLGVYPKQLFLCAVVILCLISIQGLAQNDKRATQLLNAIKSGDVEKVKHQLRDGAHANHRYSGMMTPLHMAVKYKRPRMVSLLLSTGADPLAINQQIESPLDLAMESSQNTMVAQMYLALPETIQFDYLMYILDGLVRHDAVEHYEQFLEYVPEGRTLEYYEIDFLYQAALQGSGKMLRLFLEEGRTLSESDPLNGWSVLHYLSAGGHLELIQELFDGYPEIDTKNGLDQTPLSVAVALGHRGVAAYLINAGAQVNSVDRNGYTPLHHAAIWGHTALVQFLLDNHADMGATTKAGQTPLELGLANHHKGLLDVFPAEAPTDDLGNPDDQGEFAVLRAAVQAGRVREVESGLKSSTVSINRIDGQGQALIHYACAQDTPGLIEVLVAAGADINLVDPLNSWSPLMMAVGGDHVRTAKVLLMSGANVDHQDVHGWTALHLAQLNGNEEMMRAVELAGPNRELAIEPGMSVRPFNDLRATDVEKKK